MTQHFTSTASTLVVVRPQKRKMTQYSPRGPSRLYTAPFRDTIKYKNPNIYSPQIADTMRLKHLALRAIRPTVHFFPYRQLVLPSGSRLLGFCPPCCSKSWNHPLGTCSDRETNDLPTQVRKTETDREHTKEKGCMQKEYLDKFFVVLFKPRSKLYSP